MSRSTSALIGLLCALAALAPAGPAYAASIDLRVTALWGPSGGTPGWSAYGVTVHNRGSDFSGDVRLVPPTGSGNIGSGTWTLYREPLQIGHGATKAFTMYVQAAPTGYDAEVTDARGTVAASQRLGAGGGSGRGFFGKGGPGGGAFSIGVLAGSGNPASALRGLDIAHSSVTPIAFGGSLSLPDSALHLQALDAIVIDGYDTASLLPAQLAALREYVAFGGSLIITGGSDWRRTLLPLPAELTPLRPSGTGRASLDPLAQVVDRHSGLEVTVAEGGVASGRVVAAAGGAPLVVEGGYGQGRIVELTFDPAAAEIANSDLASLVWSEAVTRAVSFTALNGKFAPAGLAVGFGPGGGYSISSGSGAPLMLGGRLPPDTFEYQVLEVLRASPAGRLPPLALLALLVGIYVLVAGPLNDVVLRRLRRRELFWLTGPAVALIATLGLYGIGSGIRGGSFHDEEVQLVRTAPDGSAMVLSYHGLFAPRRGDVVLRAGHGSLVTASVAARNFAGGAGVSSPPDEVVLGSRPQVTLRNVAIWSMRSVETASMARPGLKIRARLSIRSGRVVGEIVNDGRLGIRDLRIFSSQNRALLGSDLAPGARLTVDASLDSYRSTLMSGPPFGAPSSSPPDPATKREIAAEAAATQAEGASGQVIVTGLIDPLPDLEIPGSSVTTTALTAVAFPVSLEGADQIQGGPSASRLVATANAGSELADVYEIEVPPGTAAPSLRYGPPSGPPVDRLEVFDWSSGAWRQVTPAAQGGTVALQPAEIGGGLVRVRVHEQSPFGSVGLVSGA